ncbi:uncharacterized protein LOC144161540 [Haemaphysalis longicornis]
MSCCSSRRVGAEKQPLGGSLHGLHVTKSAHFFSLVAEAVTAAWHDTTGLFDRLLALEQSTPANAAHDVRVGMLLMDYRSQAIAARTLVGDVFFTLAKSIATVRLEAAALLSPEAELELSLRPELYNLFMNGATASLSSCLKLCQRHGAYLHLAAQAAHPSAREAHLAASARWRAHCERLFDRVVDMLADFEEDVHRHIFSHDLS